jgi:hypothetical protein
MLSARLLKYRKLIGKSGRNETRRRRKNRNKAPMGRRLITREPRTQIMPLCLMLINQRMGNTKLNPLKRHRQPRVGRISRQRRAVERYHSPQLQTSTTKQTKESANQKERKSKSKDPRKRSKHPRSRSARRALTTLHHRAKKWISHGKSRI